jgi:beta-lactamase class A
VEFLRQNKKLIVGGGILFVVGIVLGQTVGDHFTRLRSNKVAAQAKPVRAGSSDYKLINPLLGYDTAEATLFGEYETLESKLQENANTELANHDADKISVYFRDLPRGRWVGINEDIQYSPASLLKVPLMLAYYKLSESQPNLLSQQLKFDRGDGDINTLETVKGSQKIQVGKSYSIDELINYMIMYSDNDALELLYNNISQTDLNKFFSDFGILIPDVPGAPQDFISPKTYSLFFRVLYGSTYLSRFDSEKALELLSKVEYKNGLVAGVPSNVYVAHKFGEYGTIGDNKIIIREFHDCGIVYYPNHPYFLCIMTKGTDFNQLERIVKETSQVVYDEMKKEYR